MMVIQGRLVGVKSVPDFWLWQQIPMGDTSRLSQDGGDGRGEPRLTPTC